MKQRLITAAFGIALLAVVLFLYETIILNISIAVVSLLALYEVLVSTKYVKSRLLFAFCGVFTAAVPFFHIARIRLGSAILCFLFILVLFSYLLWRHKTVKLETIGAVFMLTLLMSFSFACIVFIRDRCQQLGMGSQGLFYIVLVFLGAWITDAGGYFVGRFFGRRKLAPIVSPKKTVAGAVGGVACTAAVFLAAGALGRLLGLGGASGVHFAALLVLALLASGVAILGDLSASLIKRECHIKDFGNIVPGHGGVLDRFDSVMFVAPLVFILMQILPVF